jgi:hypothetical protein
MQIWTPPHDAPHLLEWWRPLILVAQAVRAERIGWPVHLDEFRLVGRVVRSGRPDVWIYEHHQSGGPIYTDSAGKTYKFIPTPHGRGAGRFKLCNVRTAVGYAGLPDVVEPVWYEPPREGWEEHWRLQDEAAAANEPTGRQRGHLMIIDGSM